MTKTAGGLSDLPKEMGFTQFVVLIAVLMAMNAMGIDIMLPALGDIGDALHIPTANARQWIVTSYLFGFGGAQILYGPLSDRFGRKPVLLIGTGMYVVFSIIAGLATSFEALLVARTMQGVAAAAARVLAVSIVRDRYSGRQMARVMSLAFIVFLVVPMIAPSIGQAILLFAPWRWIFAVLALFGLLVTAWVAIGLPETLHPEDKRSISLQSLLSAAHLTLTNRVSVGYMIAMTFTTAGIFAYVNSAQQLFDDVFDVRTLFPSIFGAIAGSMAIASFLNARVVGRIGTRIVSHGAMLGFAILSAVHALIVFTGHETVVLFSVFQAASMSCFGLMGANFGAMAMEPMGHVAGTASSIQGFFTTVGAALLGFLVGQTFDGTVKPLSLGYVVFGIAVVTTVLVAEKGRLFRPTLDYRPPDRPLAGGTD